MTITGCMCPQESPSAPRLGSTRLYSILGWIWVTKVAGFPVFKSSMYGRATALLFLLVLVE